MPIIVSPVRKAFPDDEPQLRDIIWQGYIEQDMFKPSRDRINEMLQKALYPNTENPAGAVIGAIGPVGDVQGIIYLSIGRFEYTDDWALFETFNYVRPEFRRTTNARDMIDFGKRSAEELGVPLAIGVVSNERTKAKMELYRRRLGEPAGGYFIYRPARAGLQQAG